MCRTSLPVMPRIVPTSEGNALHTHTHTHTHTHDALDAVYTCNCIRFVMSKSVRLV